MISLCSRSERLWSCNLYQLVCHPQAHFIVPKTLHMIFSVWRQRLNEMAWSRRECLSFTLWWLPNFPMPNRDKNHSEPLLLRRPRKPSRRIRKTFNSPVQRNLIWMESSSRQLKVLLMLHIPACNWFTPSGGGTFDFYSKSNLVMTINLDCWGFVWFFCI